MDRLMQRCTVVILVQAILVIAFQVALDAILKVTYVTNCVTVINGLLSVTAVFIGFYYSGSNELKVICVHVIVLLMIVLLYVGCGISTVMCVTDPEDLKKRVRTVVQDIFALSLEQDEMAQRKMNAMQTRLHCCGVNSIVDYGIRYPQSCCVLRGPNCSLSNNNVYTNGCAYKAFFIIYNIEIVYTVTMMTFVIAPIIAVVYKARQLRKALEMLRYEKGREAEIRVGQIRHRVVDMDRGDHVCCRGDGIPMEPFDSLRA